VAQTLHVVLSPVKTHARRVTRRTAGVEIQKTCRTEFGRKLQLLHTEACRPMGIIVLRTFCSSLGHHIFVKKKTHMYIYIYIYMSFRYQPMTSESSCTHIHSGGNNSNQRHIMERKVESLIVPFQCVSPRATTYRTN